MPNVKSVFFGNSPRYYYPENPRARRDGFSDVMAGYDKGQLPSCAVNANNVVVAIHQGETRKTLNARIAEVQGVELRWRDKIDPAIPSFAAGYHPAVALNDAELAVVLYDDGSRLKYLVAQADLGKRLLVAGAPQDFATGDGTYPSVAMNRSGILVEVHQNGNATYFRRGLLQGRNVTWSEPALLASNSSRPFVSINNKGVAVAVFQRGGGLSYLLGSFDPAKTAITAPLTWRRPAPPYSKTGVRPSVALTDENFVYEVHQEGNNSVYQATGQVGTTSIEWQDFLEPGVKSHRYDDGIEPQIATNGKIAVQVHAGGSTQVGRTALSANAALILDRANWMGDRGDDLKRKTLRDIAIPGSHDAGAYADTLARTQDLSIQSQLRAGVRYFDIRPKFTGGKLPGAIVTYHDIPSGDYLGPALADVISRVRLFMESHRELVILKISHFKNFDQKVFDTLAGLILGDKDGKTGIAKWLFKRPGDHKATRLADRKLDQYLKPRQGTVLVVVDLDGTRDYVTEEYQKAGIYRYRDWYAKDPKAGDLTVFDVFSNTVVLSTLLTDRSPDKEQKSLPIGQLPKFEGFNGKCLNNPAVPCDLFLLSWTLTPTFPAQEGTPFKNAVRANQILVNYLDIPAYAGPNRAGLNMNVLYTDAVEYSRSLDAAMVRNGFVPPVKNGF